MWQQVKSLCLVYVTMVSDSIAGSTEWEIMREDTIGSDHYPIMTSV